ncbi:CPCC family cysteine-rich protein [Thorsellia anophelis]|uniref:CPCC family cysteine-rich protein n=1 Tax=Thorsellia anophelis TaxID=336804 RepID=UPI00115F8843
MACHYIVYESSEESFYEICLVCHWQTDSLSKNGYSNINKVYLKIYKCSDFFKSQVDKYSDMYKRI